MALNNSHTNMLIGMSRTFLLQHAQGLIEKVEKLAAHSSEKDFEACEEEIENIKKELDKIKNLVSK